MIKKDTGCIKPLKFQYKKKRLLIGYDIETYTDNNNEQQFILASTVRIDRKLNTQEINLFYTIKDVHDYILSVKNRNAFVISHNSEFDITLSKLHLHKHYTFFKKGKVFLAKILNPKRKEKITFIDTLNFYPYSLKKIGEMINLHKFKKPSFIGKMPKNKTEFEELENYCIQDSKITVYGYLHFLKFCETYGFTSPLTTSQSSFKLFRINFLKKIINKNKIPFQMAILRKGYYGGRTEAFRLGNINCVIRSYDINSAYLYALKNAYFPVTPYREVSPKQFKKFLNYYKKHKGEKRNIIMFGKFEFNINDDIGYIPYRYTFDNSEKLVFPNGRFNSYVYHPEILLANKKNSISKCLKLYIAYGEKLFHDFANFVWNNRVKYLNNDILNFFFKTIGNGQYGKYAQINHNLERDKKYDVYYNSDITQMTLGLDKEKEKFKDINHPIILDLLKNNDKIIINFYDGKAYVRRLKPSLHLNISISAITTSYVRAYLYNIISSYENNVIYCDTDSVFTKDLKLKENPNILGGLKLEKEGNNIKIFNEKMYIINRKATFKGIPRKNRKIKIDYLNNKITADMYKMITYRSSVKQRVKPYTTINFKITFDYLKNHKRKRLSENYKREILTKPITLNNTLD